MKETFYLSDRKQLPELIDMLEMAVLSSEHVIEIKKRVKQRSGQQNKSLHLYLTILAEKLNDAGYGQRGLLNKMKADFEIPVTPEFIKSIFREIGVALYKKSSTSGLTTIEMNEVYQIMDARMSEITGVRAEWPSSEPPAYDGEKY